MNLLSPVANIMSTKLITLSPSDSLTKVKEIFNENRIHHIPILDKGKLAGIVSKSDFLYFQKGFVDSDENATRISGTSVENIMTKGLATLESTDRINVALEIFKNNLFHAIPIVDKDQLVGIVTTLDIINHLASDKEATNKYELQ